MSNLSETGTKAFDFFVNKVVDPADRCEFETLLLDVEREAFEKGMEVNEEPYTFTDDEGFAEEQRERREDW